MAVNSVSTSLQSGFTTVAKMSNNESSSKGTATDTGQGISLPEAAVYEASEQTTKNSKNTYTRDSVTLSQINKQVEEKLSSLRGIVENLFTKQSLKMSQSKGLSYDQILQKYDGNLKEFYQNLEVDDSTRLKAQEEISEDGFWGVKQTSARAIEFAKALSGGDPSKAALLRNAIEAGYKAAEKAWGGELPEICKQTQEATLKGIDDWANEAIQ